LNGSVGCGSSENNFIGIFEAKTNNVAVLQEAAISLLSADVDSTPVSPIFEMPGVILRNNRGTLAGDTAVGQLEMISGLAATNAEG
jgi:hypothetical protein